ncbi:MAG: hypothetical protein RML45_11850 [Acetobacteraceae bacterium]|nr:hypothetical protein [Acetobacteraceae bacterium]
MAITTPIPPPFGDGPGMGGAMVRHIEDTPSEGGPHAKGGQQGEGEEEAGVAKRRLGGEREHSAAR